MSNLSDFLGGSGGGGDPQANFKAASNISADELVVLNDNGTVAGVISQNNTIDFGAENFSQESSFQSAYLDNNRFQQAFYDSTNDRYLLLALKSPGADNILYARTATRSGNTFTLASSSSSVSSITAFDADWDYSQNVAYIATRDTGSRVRIRSAYYNTSSGIFEFSGTGDASSSNSFDNQVVIIASNQDGTGIMASKANDSTTKVFGYEANPAQTTTKEPRFTKSSATGGTAIGGNGIYANNIRGSDLFRLSDGVFGMVWCNSGNLNVGLGNILHDSSNGGITTNNFNGAYFNNASISNGGLLYTAFDPINRVLLAGVNNGVYRFVQYTGDTPQTAYGTLGNFTSANNSAITYSSYLKKFVTFQHPSSGTFTVTTFIVNTTTGQAEEVTSATDTTSDSNEIFERPRIYMPDKQSDIAIVLGNTSTANRDEYILGSPPYLDTNVSKYIGQAAEAITSGSVGPVKIFNREFDIPGSSFQKGQKLYENSSGTTLATSGTNVIGYAKDADTIVVTGDSS